jgi:hypothetical protein
VLASTKERATKEFGNLKSEFAAYTSPLTSPPESRSPPTEEASQPQQPTSPRITASSMFSYLKSTAGAAQSKINPALRELSKAEDAADAYLNKLGASFGQLLKDAVQIEPPESSFSLNEKRDDILFDTSSEKRKQIQ